VFLTDGVLIPARRAAEVNPLVALKSDE